VSTLAANSGFFGDHDAAESGDRQPRTIDNPKGEASSVQERTDFQQAIICRSANLRTNSMRPILRGCLIGIGLSAGYIAHGASAQNYIAACGSHLNFDTAAIKSNFAYRLALSDTINANNFAAKKADGTVTIVTMGAGSSYKDFAREVGLMRGLYAKEVGQLSDPSILERAVQSGGWDAYSKCVADSSHRPILAWVSNVVPDEKASTEAVTVTVKTNLPGKGFVAITGDEPHHGKRLSVEGQQDVVFVHPKGADLNLGFDLQRPNGATIGSAQVSLAEDVHVNQVPKKVVLTDYGICRAGSHKGIHGNASEPVLAFKAATDATLLDDRSFAVDENPLAGSGCNKMAKISYAGFGRADPHGWHQASTGRETFKVYCQGDQHSVVNPACASYHVSVTQLGYELVRVQ
jgi:hypothetical protein